MIHVIIRYISLNLFILKRDLINGVNEVSFLFVQLMIRQFPMNTSRIGFTII